MRPLTRRAFLTALVSLPFAQRRTRRLVCFGDSLTTGAGIANPEDRYGAIVGATLGRSVDNRATNGSRIVEQLAAIRATPIARDDVVLLLAGYNDMRAGTPLDAYQQVLDEALGLLAASGALVAVGTCVRMTPEGYTFGAPMWNHGSDAAVVAINAVIIAMARAHGCRVAHTSDAVDPRNQTDVVHPNEVGQQQMAQAMLAALQLQAMLPMIVR